VVAMFPQARPSAGMYESFYLRAVSPDAPLGVWLRYTVDKRPGQAPRGSLWATVFDGESAGPPVAAKWTTDALTVPAGGWIAVGDATFGPEAATGACGPISWSLRHTPRAPELRHLPHAALYRAPFPRTKLTSPAPSATFDGTVRVGDRVIDLDGWSGMVGHNWGAEHAERWIWLHGVDFAEDPSAWIDVALGRIVVAGHTTPWIANGAISLHGETRPLGGLLARGTRVREDVGHCALELPGPDGLMVHATVSAPRAHTVGWRYDDPDGGEHDVANCSIASLVLRLHDPAGTGRALHTAHGAAYELGMREQDHGVPLTPVAP